MEEAQKNIKGLIEGVSEYRARHSMSNLDPTYFQVSSPSLSASLCLFPQSQPHPTLALLSLNRTQLSPFSVSTAPNSRPFQSQPHPTLALFATTTSMITHNLPEL